MSRIQFPYRRESTRRQNSSPDSGDFVTGGSHNYSIDSEQTAPSGQRADSGAGPGAAGETTGRDTGPAAGSAGQAGAATGPALLEALAGRRPARTPV